MGYNEVDIQLHEVHDYEKSNGYLDDSTFNNNGF
jgi:hypothetical protein